MFHHVPAGSGHPYMPDSDQRYPVLPVTGEEVTIGVRSKDEVTLEIMWDGKIAKAQMEPTPAASRGQIVDGGHLASAQAKTKRAGQTWSVKIRVPEDSQELKYRFESHGRRSQWYTTSVASWEDAPADVVQIDGPMQIVGGVQVLATSERVSKVRWSFPLASNEHVTGFGERFNSIDQRGKNLDSVVFEQYKNQGESYKTYMPMPFAHVIGGSGWGFHVRTSRRVWFDVGQENPELLTVTCEVDQVRNMPGIVEVGVYTGKPEEVLREFLNEVGHPRELSQSVFGLWVSGNEWNTQAEVQRQVALHEKYGIPISNFVIEAWSDEETFIAFRDSKYADMGKERPHLSDFSFPEDGAWPDPKGMVDNLHSKGISVYLWQIPLIKMRPHPRGYARHIADEAESGNYLIQRKNARGKLIPYRNRGWWFPLSLMPDLSDEKAAIWWTEQRRYLVEEVGIDGFKTDGGEHAWGHDLVYLDGRTGGEVNNEFPRHYATAYGNLLERCGKQPLTFSRAGYTGSQAHGLFWAGDENSTWQAFRSSMIAGLNAAASGIVYWGWDIAGFSGPVPTAELYVRAMAASVFVPIMQYHSEFNHHRLPSRDRTPWNIAETSGEIQVIDEVRALVALRERLRTYLVESARKTIESSKPLMRPLYFEFPNEPIWEDIAWMLGDDILVYPVLDSSIDVLTVYLPTGNWVNVWNSELIQGGKHIEVDVSLRTQIPVFVRESAWQELKSVFQSEG